MVRIASESAEGSHPCTAREMARYQCGLKFKKKKKKAGIVF